MNANALPALEGIVALDHLGVLRVQGADASSFLQGQLTNDFALLPADGARLAAFCSPKGRMQASFVGWKRAPDDIVLVCSRDLLAATQKRLSMFVLRAKARISDATDEFLLYGLAGSAVAQVAGTELAPWQRADHGGASTVGLYPAVGCPRALWLAPIGTATPPAAPLDAALWHWGEVCAGVATISAAVADAYVPQMLNYESVGGVSFKKGCYPGQEVVARSQFRGTLKRRGYLVQAGAAMAPADEVWAPGGTEPCGSVVQSAAAPSGGSVAIASLQVAAAETGALRLRSADGAPLELLPLPYALLADV